MNYKFGALLIALALLSVQFANADTYILNDANNTITNPQIADDGETNAIVSSGTGKGFVQGTMTILGDSTINNSNRVEMSAAITADAPYTITKLGGGQLLFMNDSSAVGKIVVNAGQVIGQNNSNSLNAINGVDLNAGTLQIWNLQNVPGHIYANGGTFQSAGGNNSFIGDITLSAETSIDVTGSYTFNTTGTIGSASDDTNVYKIHKTNSGTWNIEGTVNAGYFDVAGGTVKVLTGGSLTGTQLMFRQNNDNENTYTLTVDGGTVKFTGDDHRLGHWGKHTGVVNINSGSFSAANILNVGWDGTGKLYQTGGTATFDTLNILRSGSLIEFSGGKTTIGTMKIGVRAANTQGAAGTVTFKGNSDVSLTYLYAYHGGTLKIQDNAKVTVSDQAYFVQANNSCTFTIEQTGGTFTVNGNLALGHYNYSNVTYNISGGTLNVPNYGSDGQTGFWLAVDSDGTLNQSGGTINVGRLNLNARDARQLGTYVMTGGTLNVGTGGIMATRTEEGRYTVQLEKGTITAGASSLTANRGDWTSNLNMELTGTGADRVTFKPEDGYSITLSGVLSGSGGLVKDGAGTLILSNKNTYAGDTTVKNGTLKLNYTGGTGSLAPGAKVYVEGANAVLAGSGDILGYKGGAIGAIYLDNGGTFKNDSTNAHITVNNPIYMNNGYIYAEGNGNNDVGNFIFDNAIHVTAGTANKITATRFVLRNLDGTTYVGEDTAGLFDVASGAKLTISANISNGSGGTALIKDGEGDLELTANSTYGYGTTIKGGKVILSGDGSLGTGAVVNNATLEFACNIDKTFTPSVTGTGEVVKSGDKTLTLTGSIACEGGTTVSSGTLALSNGFGGDKRFSGDVTIADGATLLCDAHDSLGFGGNTTVLKIYGTMDNSNGNETLNNTELHMYGGTASSSSGGTFDILNTGVKFYSCALDGATPENPTVSTISSQINLRTTGTLDINTAANSQLDMTGVIYVGSGSCALKKLGDGVLTLTANNTYDSGTIVEAGKLVVSGAGTIGTGPATVADGAKLEFNVDDGAVKQTGAISGLGTVVKTGNGTLQINNEGSSETLDYGNILVQAGRADVKGLYNGTINVSGPAVFSPGNSVGTLTTDVFTLGSGATLLMEQDATGMDTLIANTFDIADDAIIEYVFTSLQPGATLTLFNDPNGLEGQYADLDYWASYLTPEDAYYWNFTTDGYSVFASVNSNAIPEPSTWALLILGAAGLLYWWKRK